MENRQDEQKRKYEELFSNDVAKAKAFDRIAEQYYFGNFGKLQKSDFETLLFSLYLDRILDISEEQMETYSDYRLSKYLGITQSRVGTLKEKKELQYPYPRFDWRRSFLRIVANARYENGKIKIHIPDRNLYLEVKNAIEEKGGFVEVQMTSGLLQVTPERFFDLMQVTSPEESRAELRENLKKSFAGIVDEDVLLREEPLGKRLTGYTVDFIAGKIGECIPVVGKMVADQIRQAVKPQGK